MALYIFQTFRYRLSLIILRIFPFEEGAIQTNLVWSFLQCDHPWESKGFIIPNELLDVEFILPDEGSETHIAVRETLAEVGISIYQLKSIMVLGRAEAVALSVEEGLGAGFVSKIVVIILVLNRVKSIVIQGLEINQDIYIGHYIDRPQSAAQAAFWKFVKTNVILSIEKY